MALYAHALIEVPVDPADPDKGVTRYTRGKTVPEDLPGIEDLQAGGAVSSEKYNPASDENESPDVVEIDGHRYIRVSEEAEGDDHASR